MEKRSEKNKNDPKKGARKFRAKVMAVTWFFVLLFISMSGYICYFALTNEQELAENPYNGIQQILMEQNTRGRIYASGGEVLAETGTDSQGRETRIYPYENLFSHVVGYATHGRAGIEAEMNYFLIQSNISLPQKAMNGELGQKNAGDSIRTTLRVDLQDVASKALGIYKGAVIVTEPDTGKILAMVSKPDFVPAEIPELWDYLINSTESSILLNRVTQGLYPPGSTFKIMTALEYIRANNLGISSYSYNCTGHFSANGLRINCFRGNAHGRVDFTDSFAKSCNSSFANIGNLLDEENFRHTLDELLFDTALPFSLPYSLSRIDLNNETTPAEMMQITIGQGKTQITPFHLNLITGAIANNGILMSPYLYEAIVNENGNILRQYSSNEAKRLMGEGEALVLRELMESVVLGGTATRLRDLSYTAAGKTGSAEFGAIKGESHAWFTGYAPAENPQICVTVIIEGAGSGGDYAVPIAKRIFDAYFD
ncbi:MAG: penicillin-binding transpeptidase domain-containing protein [Lachnospiraceae bacterium]|nr:penicillin-binding transpeptidase domain-containing protein [Lachnospiraceae bacterium]